MGLKQQLKHSVRRLFELGQYVKLDILPRHFYSEIPDIRLLRRSSTWKKPRTMEHIAGADVASQLAFVAACTEGLREKLSGASLHQRACATNHLPEGFGAIEADFLYCFLRTQRPKRILQIGCGVSTAICLMAAADDGEYKPEIICVEPYPTEFLIQQEAAGNLRLIRAKFEDTSISVAEMLQAGDLFFIDSTHTLGPAGEVTQLICDILPQVPAGVWVHFHDIVFPYDYSTEILNGELFFGHETALLHAFLTQNAHYRMEGSLSMLHHLCPAELGACLPNYQPAKFDEGVRISEGHFPSSVYLRAV